MDADDANLTCARLCQLQHCLRLHVYGMQYSQSCAARNVLCTQYTVICNAGDASSSISSIVLSILRLWSGQLKGHFCVWGTSCLPCLPELLLCLKHGITPTCTCKCTLPGLRLTCYKHAYNIEYCFDRCACNAAAVPGMTDLPGTT